MAFNQRSKWWTNGEQYENAGLHLARFWRRRRLWVAARTQCRLIRRIAGNGIVNEKELARYSAINNNLLYTYIYIFNLCIDGDQTLRFHGHSKQKSTVLYTAACLSHFLFAQKSLIYICIEFRLCRFISWCLSPIVQTSQFTACLLSYCEWIQITSLSFSCFRKGASEGGYFRQI